LACSRPHREIEANLSKAKEKTMKLKEVMVRDIATCAPHTNLAEAAWKMWEKDCGALPVVLESKVVGMITDRDVAMAVATNDRSARGITVGEIIAPEVHACHVDDEVETALEIMATARVRRLPVVDDDDTLRGVISMNDLLLMTGNGKTPGAANLASEKVLSSVREISKHRRQAEVPQMDNKATSKKTNGLPKEVTQKGRQ
jgi:CBS domain-containing protein